MLEISIVLALIGVVLLTGPGLGTLRSRFSRASAGWLVVGVVLEVFSVLSYVIVFRAVFCARMSWRLSYQIATSEQGANSVFAVSGAGGLALGAWALRRGGMSTEYIGRRTVAFFFLTSIANVGTLILFAVLYATGILQHDRDPALVYAFAAAGIVASAIVVLVLPRLRPRGTPLDAGAGRVAHARRFARNSLGQGVRDALLMLRRRPAGILIGAFGVTGFDIAVLGVCFKAFGHSPPVGVLVVGYLIGQLGGNIPLPGGIGGLDLGLIGVFALLHQPLAVTTASVLLYHAISLWIPALLGFHAYFRLRRTLQREPQAAAMCMPLAEPIATVRLPAR